MAALFGIKQNPESQTEFKFLDYEWLDVIAIVPNALGNPGEEYGDWCYKVIRNWYICNSEKGIVRVLEDDFWAAIEEYNECQLAHAGESPPPLIITAGSGAMGPN